MEWAPSVSIGSPVATVGMLTACAPLCCARMSILSIIFPCAPPGYSWLVTVTVLGILRSGGPGQLVCQWLSHRQLWTKICIWSHRRLPSHHFLFITACEGAQDYRKSDVGRGQWPGWVAVCWSDPSVIYAEVLVDCIGSNRKALLFCAMHDARTSSKPSL